MKNSEFNPKVDAYIAKAQPFAQPILTHIRELVHKACPEVEEAIKFAEEAPEPTLDQLYQDITVAPYIPQE